MVGEKGERESEADDEGAGELGIPDNDESDGEVCDRFCEAGNDDGVDGGKFGSIRLTPIKS